MIFHTKHQSLRIFLLDGNIILPILVFLYILNAFLHFVSMIVSAFACLVTLLDISHKVAFVNLLIF